MVGAVGTVGRGAGVEDCWGARIGAVVEGAGVAVLVAVIGAGGAGICAVVVATVGARLGAGIGACGWWGSTDVLRMFSKQRIAVLSFVPVCGNCSVGWGFFKVSNRSPRIMVNFLVFVGVGMSQSCRKYSTVSEVQNSFVLGTQETTFR